MILAHAIGVESNYRQPCREVISVVASGTVDLHMSAQALQELLLHRMRRADTDIAIAGCRAVADLCVIHPIDAGIVSDMVDLVAGSGIRGRDAIHAATALAAGFKSIVSTDSAFDEVDGLGRVDPQDALRG